jgi:DNA recombination protein RmuC
MNDGLILLLAILASTAIGAYVGILFIKLKSKSEQSTLEERNSNLAQQLQDLRIFHQTENAKQDSYFNTKWGELSETISKIEHEREEIRKEKDLLNRDLSRRNAEFENLQENNLKRDEQIEIRQEQLRKDFEIYKKKFKFSKKK